MNNATQHFVTAFLDLHLKDETARADYLRLAPKSVDGVDLRDDRGHPMPGHTFWKGFPPRTAVGLRFETLEAGN